MRFAWLAAEVLGASILISSGAGTRSHVKAILEVGQTLGERGHSVRYVALDDNIAFASDHPNVSTVALGHSGQLTNTIEDIFDAKCGGKLGEDYKRQFAMLSKVWMSETYRLEYRPLLEHVTQDKPDLMVCDFFAIACVEIAEAHAIPLVMGIQTLDFVGFFNAPFVATDTRFGPVTIDGKTFAQRMFDTLVAPYFLEKVWLAIAHEVNLKRKELGSTATGIPRDALNYGVALSNSFVGFEVAQPLPPSVRVIGPIFSSKVAPLDSSLSRFLGTHQRVLFVAFGSLISLHPPEINTILHGVLKAMDQGLIDGLVWGLGRTRLSNFPNATHPNFLEDPRFLILPWAPQQSILSHPSTVAFLSHGGMESCFEAMYTRTPVLAFPFLSDQARNARKLYEMGVGVHVDPANIDIAASLQTLLSLPALESSLAKAKALTNPHLQRRQEAANYIENHLDLALACRPYFPYVPGSQTPPCEISHLLPASNNMGFVKANRLDVYFAVSAITLMILGTVLRSVVFAFSALPAKTKTE